MLSVSRMGSGQQNYYLELAREDYYLEGGEPEGRWVGEGAHALGLGGAVTKEQLSNLLQGQSPDGTKPLVRANANRQPGWDLTFSAPKSVSVLWALAPEELARAIQEAHFEAVRQALGYIQENATFTRRGHAGAEIERTKLIAATFEHGTSRAQDPQLHTHALLINLGVREDGTTGTIRSRDFYQQAKTAGAFYRTVLAELLSTRLGLALERGEHSFEIRGVPQALRDRFSQRRKAIEEALATHGAKGAKAAEHFTLSTRAVKEHVARAELFARWQEVGREFGFRLEGTQRQPGESGPSIFSLIPKLRAMARDIVRDLTNHQSTFLEREVLARMLQRTEHLGVGADVFVGVVRGLLQDPHHVTKLVNDGGYTRYTTPEMLALEKEMLRRADWLREAAGPSVPAEKLAAVKKRYPLLNEEQTAALETLTSAASGRMANLVGMAGTGKTYLLDAVREAYETHGHTVRGTALSGKAALGLQSDAGIPSKTIRSFLAGVDAWEKKNPRQKKKGAETTPIASGDVLVLDEAGMVGTKDMNALFTVVERYGAKILLVGDHRQLQPIDAGGPFAAIIERHGKASLKEIMRQKEAWMRKAVHHFADGRAEEGLQLYASRGRFHLGENRDEARQTLLAKWQSGRTTDLSGTLIIAGTNADVEGLNRGAQEIRQAAGELRDPNKSLRLGDGTPIYARDRILFTKNDRLLGVKNGDFGTIERVGESQRLTVLLDRKETSRFGHRDKRITVDVRAYSHLKLGYASTAHKAQGATVDRTFVLAGGWMQDRELTYVEMSRHRHDCNLFAARADVSEDLGALVASMERSRAKELAVAVKERLERAPTSAPGNARQAAHEPRFLHP